MSPAGGGTPVGETRSPEVLRTIRPQPVCAAPANTLSSRYGMGTFPFHTDTVYWRTPARFIPFHCVNTGSGGRPTLLLDPHHSPNRTGSPRPLQRSVADNNTPALPLHHCNPPPGRAAVPIG